MPEPLPSELSVYNYRNIH